MALNLSSMTPQEQIATLFIAYFDRAPAPSGLDYWVGRLNDGMSIAEIATSFAAQPETLKLYPELGAANAATPTSNLALVTDIFNNLFGRDPAGGADNYWVQQLNSGADIGSIIINIASGAVGDDKALLENKIEVGLDWSTEALIANIATVDNPLSEVVDGKLNILDEEAYESAKTVLDSVTADPATVDAAKAATDDFIAAYGNDAPIAANDTAAVDEDGVLDNGVISTAADPDGDVLIYSIAPGDAPSNGAIVMNADGTYVYTPDADFNGTDTFTYTVTDPSGETDSATVTITVAPQNDAPIAGSIQGGAIEGGSVATVDLKAVTSDIDGDALTYALVTSADGVSIDSATGVVSLDPTVGAYDGLAQGEMLQIVVGYSVSDGTATVQSTVQFTVTGTNDAPVASGSVSSVAEDNSVMGTVRATDVDGSADDLVYSVAAGHGPSNGALSMDANGAYTYTPDADFNGTDSFTYTVTDADGGQDTAVVDINVAAVDDAPVASNATASVNEDATISGQLVATDIDNDDAAIVYTVDTNVAGLTLNADGSWEFNAADVAYQSLADGETQVVATTYTATSNGKTDTGAINITVTGTNDAPQAQALTVSGIENLEVVGRVQATDVDGDALTFTVVEGSVQNGAVSMDAATGAFVFTPNPFFSGEATFDYTVSDGDLTSTETVTIDVADVVNVLTTGVDNIPLTGEGVEVVRGSTDTLNPGDRVSGSEEDIVSIGIDGDNPSTYSAFEIDGIGKFVVTNDGSNPVTFDMSSSSGVKTLASENSTNDVRFDFANMNDAAGSADQELNVEVRNLTNGVNFTLDVRDIDQGGDDIVNMLVIDSDDDMLDADTINIVADSQADGSTETASGVEEVNLSTAGSTGSVRINDLNTYGVRTLNISTAVGLVIGDAAAAAGIENAISSTIETVDATGSTGAVTLSTVDSTTGMDVTGGDGNDVFELGGTNDTVDGGAGNDTITATGGDNNISGGDGDDDIVTGDGDDVIDLGEGNDFVDSGAGDDTITNDGGNNTVIAGDGNDSITLGDGDNYINSGAGDDTITAGNGDNDVISGDGNDSITLGDGFNIVDAGAGNDSITLGHGPNDITAGDGDDAITAGNGDNDVDAGAGNDSVTLGDGDNIVDAGDGTNAITAGDGQNEVYGGANVDSITLGDGGNYVEAGAGNDAVTTGDGIDGIDGGDGDDTLSAGGGDDIIYGGAGADDIYGGAGADLIITGDATDASNEFVDAGAGDDTVITLGEQLTGADVLGGGADNDTLNINSANGDTSGLNNVTGFETINLNGGNHAYTIANGSAFDADTTAVTIDASDVNKTGADSANVDASTLSRGITLIGGDGDDTLIGGAGDDVIVGDGDTGADSGGVDDLQGGAGNDQFLFETGELTTADAVDGGEGDDEIVLTENSSNAVAGIGAGVTSIERVLAHDNTSGTVSVEFNGFTNGDLTNVVHVDGSQLVTNDLTVSQIGQTAATADGSEGDDVDLRITGGQGDDEFALGQYLDAGDTIDGGSVADGIGYDDEDTLSLEVNAPDTLADVDFTNVSNIEILRVFSTGGGTVVLGQAAFDAGIHTVVLDGGPLTLDASAFPGELTIFDSDASNTITGPAEYASVIKMAGGDDIVTTGSANDTVEINDGDLTFADTITDNGGTDAVVFQNGAAGNAGGIAAAVDLTNVTGIEEYTFAEDGAGGTDTHSLTFRGGDVDTLTQITVDASGVTDTHDSLSLTLEATVDVDYAFNITGTSGDDLFVKEGVNNNNLVISGADGDDILRIDGGELGSNVLFDGGEGDETDGDAVQLSGGVFRDDDFVSLVDGTVERLITVNGVQMDAVLGEEAASAGISKIEMGDDGGTVLLDPAFTNDLEVVLGSGADQFDASATDVTLTIEGTATDLNGDVIQGGAGADDVINVTADGTTADVTQVSGVEAYVVEGSGEGSGGGGVSTSFYVVDPGNILPSSGTFAWTGPVAPEGTAVIYDNEPGIEGQTLDDDSAGDETATADVTLGALVSIGSDVDAEESWLVRDLSTGEEFVIVRFDVEDGPASGDYTLSERPLDPTTTYEILEYDSNPDVTDGDPAYRYPNDDIGLTFADSSFADVESGRISVNASALNNGDLTVDGGSVTGSNAFDIVASAGDDNITTGTGDDVIDLGEGNDFVDSGAGDDTITNDGGNNTVIAGDGDDSVALGDGDNAVDTGAGDDSITLGNGNNLVAAGEGDNSVAAGDGDNAITAGAGRDIIELGDGDNTVDAGEGNNDLTAGDGNNTVTTGAGIDILALGDGDNTVDAGDGDNTVTVGTGSNSVTTGAGVDTVTVLAADVGVVPGGNLIKVGAGDDVVTASGGDDVIFGGFGVDVLSGGDGADSFHYAERDESYSIYQDRITDFESGIDQIVIEENLLTQMEVEAGITLSGVDFVGTVANFGDAELAVSTLPRLGNGVAEAVFQQDTGMFWVDLNDDGELDGRDLRVEVDFADGTLGSMSAGDVALLDTLAPAQALGIDLHAADDSGVSDTDNLTNAAFPSADVSFETLATDGSAALAGDTVKIFVNGFEADALVLTPADIANGFVTFSGALLEGAHDIAAEIIDQTGNSLGVSDTLLTVTIDRTAPDLPIIDTVAGDDIVNAAEETDLVISGTGEAGVAVAVSGDSGFSAGTTVDEEGNWSVTVSDASDTFGEGAETLSVTFTDDAGNVSATETRDITVDTIAPTIAIDTPIEGDDIVNAAEDGNVSISGTTTGVEDGQTVIVTFTDESGAQVTKTAVVSGNTWETVGIDILTFTFDQLSGTGEFDINTFFEGGADYGILLNLVDGVITSVSDYAAPSAPGAGDWDVSIDNNVVTLTAQTVAGQEVLDGLVGAVSTFTTETVGGNTSFVEAPSFDISGLNNGDILVTADVSDFAGNPAAQASTTVELDNIAPDAPSITHFADDTGASDSDGITNDGIITLYGVGEPGATIEIFDNEVSVGTTLVEEDGGWGFTTASLVEAQHNFTAEATDVAGNTSQASNEMPVTIDITWPSVTTLTVDDTMLSESDVGTSALKVTIDFDEAMDTNIDPTLTLSGEDGTETAAINDALTLDASLSGWVDSDTYEAYYDLTDTDLEADDIDIEVTLAEDVAGNVQNSHDELNEFSIDTVADLNAVDLLVASDTGLSGEDDITYETNPTFQIDFNDGVRAGDSIELLLDGASFGTAVTGIVDATDVSNGYIDLSVTGEDLGADGDKSITAKVTDLAGNTDTTDALTIHLDTLATIGAVDLVAGSDSGSSDSDDNSYVTDPTFQVTLGADAEVGDSVELLLGGAAFANPVTKTLDQTDIDNGNVNLQVTAGDLGADGDKSITAKFTDVAGNTATSAALTYTLDTTAPAPTITSIVYDNELDTLVINGSSLDDVTFDATMMTWDIQGTSATDFTFEASDLVGQPTVTGSQISMQLTAEASDALEGLAGFAGSVEDNFDFAGAAWTDTAGNISAAIGDSAAIKDQTITLNLLGTDNDDVIYGGSAGDTLEGGLGADTLIGRVGNDTIDVGADTSVDIVVYNTNTDGTDTILNFDSEEDKYDTNFVTDDGDFNEWVNLATNTTSSGGNVTITANEVDNDVFYYSGALGLDPTTATRNDVMVSLESALNSGADTSSTNGSFSGVEALAEFLLVLHDTNGSETYVLEVETAVDDTVLDLAEADLVGIFIGQNLVNGDII